MKNEELKKRVRQLLAALPAVAVAIAVAVTLALGATSCTDELENANSPVGPGVGVEAGEGITLSFRLPEKPRFGENSNSPVSYAATPSINRGGFGDTPALTRAVPGFPGDGNGWKTGDEVLVKIKLNGNGTNSNIITGRYYIYTTLRYTAGGEAGGSTGSWQLVTDGALIRYIPKDGGTTTDLTNADLPLLVADPTDGTVRLRLPAEVADAPQAIITTNLYYAPGLQWTPDGSNSDDALRQSLRPGILPGTTEFWQTMGTGYSFFPSAGIPAFNFAFIASSFSPVGSRLRIYTGRPGDEITLTSPKFTPSAGAKNTTNNSTTGGLPAYTYTVTTDADGNAYFYGYTDGALDGSGSGGDASTDNTFTVKGNFQLIPDLPASDANITNPTEIFAANASATVQMPKGNGFSTPVTGHFFAIDASFIINTTVSAKQQETFAVVDARDYDDTDAGRTALTKALTDAYANGSGKTTWQITGLAVNPDGTNQKAVSAKIGAIKSALNNKSGITLYLPDATTLETNAFKGCNALIAISMPALTTLSGNYAFDNCKALTTVSMSALTTISGNNTFYSTALTDINLPALETISGADVFSSCTALTTVTLPALTIISGNTTFNSCKVLETASLPKLTTISGGTTFYNCSFLATVTLPKLTTISRGNTFFNCKALETITFGSPITTIHKDAFNSAPTTNITLILSPNQKELSDPDCNGIYTATNTPFSGWGEGKTFAGKTFKEIVAASE